MNNDNTIVVVYRKHKLKDVYDMYVPDLGILIESPNNGDIATLNVRALSYLQALIHYYEEHGTPLTFRVTFEEGGRYRKSASDYVSYLNIP